MIKGKKITMIITGVVAVLLVVTVILLFAAGVIGGDVGVSGS